MKAIICDKVFDGENVLKNRAVLHDKGTIHSIVMSDQVPKSCEIEAYENCILAPGFIDLQVNGGGGVLFNDAQNSDSIRRIGNAHQCFGTTSFTPTLISDSDGKMQASLDEIQIVLEEGYENVLGVHFEGPFLDIAKRGAHRASQIRQISETDIQFLLENSRFVKLLTVAPENVGKNVIEILSKAGIRVCIGHSNATYEQTVAAVNAGASCFTHLFNAMSGFSARAPGVIGAALACETSWCGLIVDDFHVHPAALKIALASKPRGKCFLVTDSMSTVGTDRDTFNFFGEELRVRNDQIVSRDGVLSGSNLNMAKAVSNCAEVLELPVEEALRMASLYPAEFLGISDQFGKVAAGYKADLVILDNKFNVVKSWKSGLTVRDRLPPHQLVSHE